VPGVVAFDIGPKPGEVKTSTSSRGPIPTLDPPVEPAYDAPFQPVQQAVGRRDHFRGVRGVVPPADSGIMAAVPRPASERRAARG